MSTKLYNPNYDVVIIGAGPGGYVCAIRASQLGKKTAIIDKEWLGGVCLNVGCIPSKTILKNAEVVNNIRNNSKQLGISFDNLQIDYSAAVNKSRKVSKRLTKGIEHLLKKNKVDFIKGKAQIVSNNSIVIKLPTGDTKQISASDIVIATGARPKLPSQFNVDEKQIISYQTAILQKDCPKSVAIIGGGAIGVEFATIWNSYGSQVSIIETMNDILPKEDEDISKELNKSLTKSGIKIYTNSTVKDVNCTNGKIALSILTTNDLKSINVDQVLIAIGFTPNIEGLNLSKVGVEFDSNNFIRINDNMSTNVKNIYAIGDVTGKLLLAHVASAQGIIAAETISQHPTTSLNYKMLPKATYCNPEVASFGYTENEALEAGYDIKTSKFQFRANGKALSMGAHNGWVKIISETKTDHILGAHLIGPQVTELLPELSLAYNLNLTTLDVAQNIHAHPTLSEAIMETAQGLNNKMIHQ